MKLSSAACLSMIFLERLEYFDYNKNTQTGQIQQQQ